MSTYQELLAQRDALNARISTEYARLRVDAISTVKGICEGYDLTPEEVFPVGKPGKAKGTGVKVPPKYRDPTTGQTWTGRGKPPVWIRDRDRAAFEITTAPINQ